MIKIEPRVEYAAQQITEGDFVFDVSLTHVQGIIYRKETRTARLMTDAKLTAVDAECPEDDENDNLILDRLQRRNRSKRRHVDHQCGVTPPTEFSFFGIGCWIILKNGNAIDIVGPEKFEELYRAISKSS